MFFSVRKLTKLHDIIQQTLETDCSMLFFDTWISNNTITEHYHD